MATGQTILNRMELVDQELQLQSSEADVVRGLIAANVAQDYFESRLALHPNALVSGTGTVVTAANTETTALPTGMLRLDGLQFINASTSRPDYDLIPIKRTGGQVTAASWPAPLWRPSGSGAPTAYWTNGTSIYWSPLPNAVHTVRWHGLVSATDITASGTFAYPDSALFPLAVFAARILKLGIGDPQGDYEALAEKTFDPVISAMTHFQRDGAQPFRYTEAHDT